MGLTREDLEQNVLRKSYECIRHDVPIVPAEEFHASLTILTTLAAAHGRFGSGADYLHQTVDCLAANGIHDAHLVALRERVLATTCGACRRAECHKIGA